MTAYESCEECGFAHDLDDIDAVPATIQAGAAELGRIIVELAGTGRAHDRPEPHIWSPLEYGCHVRDVLLVQRERVLLARREDNPSLATMGRDERADHDGYLDQHPSDVARQLGDAALLFAHVLTRLNPTDWDRTVLYNYPRLQPRPLRWVAVHALHEVRHHIFDVRRQVGGAL